MARQNPAALQQQHAVTDLSEAREAERTRRVAASVDTEAVTELASSRTTARRTATHRLHVDVAEDLWARFEDSLGGLGKRQVVEQLIEGWVSGR